MGADIKEVFTRFATGCNAVQEVVKAEGYDFMHNDHLGYVLVCPSNLGTGLRASVMVKIPLLSARKDFKVLEVVCFLYPPDQVQDHYLKGTNPTTYKQCKFI